jgi:hypothetical protein
MGVQVLSRLDVVGLYFIPEQCCVLSSKAHIMVINCQEARMIISVSESDFSFKDAFDIAEKCQSIQAFLGLITVL